MIATERQTASGAVVPAIRKRLRHVRAAHACLACAPRIYFHHSPASILRFVDEHRYEHRPSGIVNRLRQHSTGEPLHIQIFNRNHTVLVDQLARKLVLKVQPLISHVRVGALQLANRFAAAVTPLILAPRHLALSGAQTGFGFAIVPGIR